MILYDYYSSFLFLFLFRFYILSLLLYHFLFFFKCFCCIPTSSLSFSLAVVLHDFSDLLLYLGDTERQAPAKQLNNVDSLPKYASLGPAINLVVRNKRE